LGIAIKSKLAAIRRPKYLNFFSFCSQEKELYKMTQGWFRNMGGRNRDVEAFGTIIFLKPFYL
jgi:hypothetical protein